MAAVVTADARIEQSNTLLPEHVFRSDTEISRESLRETPSNGGCEKTRRDRCDETDIGLVEPCEYEERSGVFMAGRCARRGGRTVTEIDERKSGG